TTTQPLPGGKNVLYFNYQPSFPPVPDVPDSLVLYVAPVDQYGCVGPNRGTVRIFRSTYPPVAAQPYTNYYHINADANCQAYVAYQTPTGIPACSNLGYAYVNRISGLPPYSSFPLGTSNVVFRITDNYGDTADVTTTIEVVDVPPPTI